MRHHQEGQWECHYSSVSKRRNLDVRRCPKWLEYIDCDGVMTSEAIFKTFHSLLLNSDTLKIFIFDFPDISEKYRKDINTMCNNLFKSQFIDFNKRADIRNSVIKAPTVEAIIELINSRHDELPQSKIEWYHRNRKIHQNEFVYKADSWEEYLTQMNEMNKKKNMWK